MTSHRSVVAAAARPTSPALAALPDGIRRLVSIAFWGNLVCQMGIIVTGGIVRLTGSGLGCSTWPNCEPGQFIPTTSNPTGFRAFIEFGNRSLTGVLSVFAIAVLLVAWRWLRYKGRGFVWLAALPLVGTVIQAVIGMVIVKMHLHPGAVAPHFLVSIFLVVVSTILVARLYEGDGPRRRAVPGPVMATAAVLAVVAAAVLVLGTVTTSSGPHTGDLEATLRTGLDPRTVSWLHADAVMLFCGLLVGMLLVLHLIRARTHAKRAAWALVVVTLLQAAIGYVQYFTALPVVLVALHMTGAALFTAAVTWLVTAMSTWQSAPLADAEATERTVEVSA
ncbi:COX15/CtaA family protein [Brachybacterium huguangmaarense]